MIELKNLSKTYHAAGREIVALDGINLTIHDGEIFGIIGLSGAGKSTLVRCINLLEEPTGGEVVIDGQSLTKLPRKELLKLRQQIGMIFQGFNLLEQRNLIRNICFPLEIAGVDRKTAAARAKELLKLVGLEDRGESYPSQLSGGQKQRVAIARALATNPKYLLCDEATSALDPNTTRQILDLLKEINEKLGVTIVVITHEMRVIDRICDSVAVIDSSHIAEMGKVAEVFTNPKSKIARDLIVPKDSRAISTEGGRRIRLTFNGQEKTNEPFISKMVLECGAPVNILFADTRIFEGVLHGHMVIELPNDTREAEKIVAWLKGSGVSWKEDQITPLMISSAERAADDTMGVTSVIAAFAIEVLTEADKPAAFISGENRLLNQPEFRDPDKAHAIMNYLSGGGYVLPPDEDMGGTDEVRVLIGPENVAEELKGSSVVIASYDAGDNTRGLIGVVGPTRMDYSAVAAKLSFLAAGLSRRLGGGEAPPEGLHNKLIIKGDEPNEHR